MHLDLMQSKVVQNNLVLFGEVELILGLPYLLPILEEVHTLIKFVYHQDVFIVEFVDVVKVAKAKLFKLHTNPYSHFENMAFDVFKFLINHSNE